MLCETSVSLVLLFCQDKAEAHSFRISKARLAEYNGNAMCHVDYDELQALISGKVGGQQRRKQGTV